MGNRYALVIGVSEYGEGLHSLPGSLLDAEGMAQVLEDPDRGAFQVQRLLNPDRLQMEGAIERFFAGRNDTDLLLLYFSGHGDLGNSISQQELHLCAKGTTKEGKRLIESSAMSAGVLKRRMGLCRSQQIVVILDCCYSGAIADLLKKGEGGIDFEPLSAPGRVVLASSNSSQVSYQAVDGLSLYTHYLIEGMAGVAHQGQQPWIVAHDLHKYAERRFEIEHKGATQPKIIVVTDEGYAIPIVKAPKPDPKVEYRQEVDRLFQELDLELGWRFSGVIEDPLDRGLLETLRQKLGLAEAEAQQLEAEVATPYKARAEKRRQYANYFEAAIQNGYLPGDRARRRLEEIQQNLSLGKDDAEAIEQSIARERNLQPAPPERSTPPIPDPPPIPATPKPEVQPSSQPPDRKTFSFETVTLQVKTETVTSEQPGFLGIGKKQVSQERQTLIPQQRSGTAEYFTEDLGNGIALEMVSIPAGEFLMGAAQGEEGASSDEYPQHRVRVPAFWMGKFAVTQAQWKAVAQLPKVQRDLEADPSRFKGADLPVEQVSWWDAVEFCDRLSRATGKTYRLPTEAEWEYACRAGTTTPFHFGETISTDVANYDGNYIYGKGKKGQYRKKTTSVGTFPPNAFGLHEMHGNVWEWCLDHWHGSYKEAPIDGSAWLEQNAEQNASRVLRGGSWFSNPRVCRSANRDYFSVDNRGNSIGFRVVYSITPGLL